MEDCRSSVWPHPDRRAIRPGVGGASSCARPSVRTNRGEPHGLGQQVRRCFVIPLYAERFGRVRGIAKHRPVNDPISCLIPNLCQMDKSFVHRHQPTTIFGTDRVSDLDYLF